MPSVFISYSRQDSAHAVAIADHLRSEGLDVWFDQHGIEGGEVWGGKIVQAIADCNTFLLLLSPSSVESHNVLKETMLASEKLKRIVPVELTSTRLSTAFEYPLAGIQRVAFTTTEDIGRMVKGLPTNAPIRHHNYSHGGYRYDSRKSLMVMPFEDLSPTQDNAWFADGLVSELISVLSGLKDLRLIDESTSRDYRKLAIKTFEIAKELNVRYFIEGNVRKFGDQIKISVQLLDIQEGEYIWTDSHKGVFADIFDIQEEVAKRVVEGLKLTLTKEEETLITGRGTENVEAYELKLKSDEFASLQTLDGYRESLRLSKEAIALDPGFQEAYFNAAAALNSIYRSYDRKAEYLDESERLVKEGLSKGAHDHRLQSVMVHIHAYRGQLDRAEETAKEYVRLAPNSVHSHMCLGFVYYLTKEPEKAIAPLREAIRLKPDEITAYSNLAANYDRMGDKQGAKRASLGGIPFFLRRLRSNPEDEYARVKCAHLYRFAEDYENAIKILEPLKDEQDIDGNNLYNIGCLYAVLGDNCSAMQMLHRAIDNGFVEREVFNTDPDLNGLRDLPEFAAILARVGEMQGSSVAA
ncbi:MAG TPA: TIR domain-containing protein [Candidatus Kapabacteria bacterium]|nr:TIR domain-containing protein [Candidatus Kapabacteria bacterium]